MRLNTDLLVWGMHRTRTARRLSVEEVASDSWEISPEHKAASPPAIFLEGALDKITAFSPWTSWEYEKPRVHGETILHSATVAYLLRDARLNGAWLYCGAHKGERGFGEERLLNTHRSKRMRLSRAHLVSNSPGSNFFGNFVLDDFPLALLPDPEETPIVLETKVYEHEAGYRQLLDLPRPQVVHLARADELVVYTDFAQNASKRSRYDTLRKRLRTALDTADEKRIGLVYLKRGATGESRLVANEPALEAHLEKRGFEIVEPARLSAEETSRRLLDARLIVSVEGSHLSHAIYSMAGDGAFLVLEPPDRFATPYKEFADCMDMRFAFLVGDPAEGGFSVDLDDLDRLLDRLA